MANKPKNNKSKRFIWGFSVLGIYNFEAALNQSVTLALLKCHLWALVSLSFQSYDVTYTFKSRVGCDSKDTSPTSNIKFFSPNLNLQNILESRAVKHATVMKISGRPDELNIWVQTSD